MTIIVTPPTMVWMAWRSSVPLIELPKTPLKLLLKVLLSVLLKSVKLNSSFMTIICILRRRFLSISSSQMDGTTLERYRNTLGQNLEQSRNKKVSYDWKYSKRWAFRAINSAVESTSMSYDIARRSILSMQLLKSSENSYCRRNRIQLLPISDWICWQTIKIQFKCHQSNTVPTDLYIYMRPTTIVR